MKLDIFASQIVIGILFFVFYITDNLPPALGIFLASVSIGLFAFLVIVDKLNHIQDSINELHRLR